MLMFFFNSGFEILLLLIIYGFFFILEWIDIELTFLDESFWKPTLFWGFCRGLISWGNSGAFGFLALFEWMFWMAWERLNLLSAW